MNVLVILSTFLAYLSPYVNPTHFWQFSFFGLIYPWLLLTNLLFVFFWLIKKKKNFLLSLGCILLGWNHVTSFVGFHTADKIKTEEVITVGSFNLHSFGYLYKGLKTKVEIDKREKEFVQFLKQGEEIQILCTQETTKRNIPLLTDKFNFPFFHRYKSKGAVIFSKFPILNSGEVNFERTSNSCVWADLNIQGQKVRVYSIHFQSNQVSTIADKVVAEGDLRKKETLKDIKGMMGKFKFYTQRRTEQAQRVANHMSTSPHPIIVCGDFNDTPQSYTYHLLTEHLKDSFKEKGSGIGTTYAGNVPALRIDYILLHKTMTVHSLEVLRGNYSDHYPVISKISLKK